MPNLYETLKAAGCKLDSHESDLYVEATPDAKAILLTFPIERTVARIFKNNLDGKMWYDVPFAYEPWWDARRKTMKGETSAKLLAEKVSLEPITDRLKRIMRGLPEGGTTRGTVECCVLKLEAVQLALDSEAEILAAGGE